MVKEEILLFFHLLSAFIFVSCCVSIFILKILSISLRKVLEISLLLTICRYFIFLIFLSLFFTLFFGLWLCYIENYWNEGWIHGTLILIGWMLLIGGYAGRKDKQTRLLALSESNQEIPSELLINKLKDPFNNILNTSMIISIIIIIALMVFKPGH